jgi:hypothetical protein
MIGLIGGAVLCRRGVGVSGARLNREVLGFGQVVWLAGMMV